MDGRDPETKRRQAIVDFSRRRSKRGCQDTHRERTQEDMEETQEAGLAPTQEAETGDNVGVQEDEGVKQARPHIPDSANNVEVKNVGEVQP